MLLYNCRACVAESTNVAQISSKCVHGIQTDPLREYRFASFSDEGVIKVWDSRKLAAGGIVAFQSESRNVVELAWSPHRPGLLASTSRDDAFLTLWELHDQPGDDSNAASITPVLLRSSHTRDIVGSIQSFAWNPSVQDAVITINRAGALENVTVIFFFLNLFIVFIITCIDPQGTQARLRPQRHVPDRPREHVHAAGPSAPPQPLGQGRRVRL